MLDNDKNIDLDALFDSLNIAEGRSDYVTTASIAPHFDVDTAEIQELSPMDADFYLLDVPTDQS